jgi:hypothetical protein
MDAITVVVLALMVSVYATVRSHYSVKKRHKKEARAKAVESMLRDVRVGLRYKYDHDAILYHLDQIERHG